MTPHPTIIAAAKLLKEKWPTCSTWNNDQILNWIGIFNSKKQIGIVQDENGECCGVGAVRFLHSVDEAEDLYANHLDGHIAWIEMVATTKPLAVQTLWLAMKNMCPPQVTKLGGMRKGVSRLYDFQRYHTLLMNRI